jgi:penicillin amidase
MDNRRSEMSAALGYDSDMRRILVKTAAIGTVGLAVLCLGMFAYLRRSLPETSGTVVVPGIGAQVEIVRDSDGIPHIFAASKLDALFGLGFVHAQDRLWQMEFQRRIGHGRLSEIFGQRTLGQDRFLRTLGFGRAARTAWDRLPVETRRQVDAYVGGVNAFLENRTGSRLPPEFTLLRVRPEPWSGPDVLVWGKMMAWDLSANYSFELLRHDLLAAVGEERLDQLMPPYPAAGLNILGPDHSATHLASQAPAGRRARGRPVSAVPGETPSWSASWVDILAEGHPAVTSLLLGGATTEALGSNNWVVDGTMTASGMPLLANDPHLSTNIPSTWYLAHMSAGDWDVIGATLPGTPAVAIGRNRHIAWGATNVAADVQDLYRERLDPSGTTAEFRGRQEPLRFVREVIGVRGREPVEVEVRVSRHGPLVSDALNAAATEAGGSRPLLEPLAFRWTALDEEDTTLVAFLRLSEARDWEAFTSALREFVVPSQNFVYADVEGHIGYYAPGRIPVRAAGDGSRPADGWTGEMEWTGWVPFEQLPHAYDPPERFIVTANHRPAAPAGSPFIGLEFPEPYRASRIIDLLRRQRARGKLVPEDFRAIQADTLSLHAQALVPVLMPHADPATPESRTALATLRDWDFDARGDSGAAAIFEAWFLQLAPALAGDELGAAVLRSYQGRFSYISRFVRNTLASGQDTWCDDVRTEPRETCRWAVTHALEMGLASMTNRLGRDMSRWRWDAAHRAVFPHQGLDGVPGLRLLLSRSVPNSGDWSTVNVGPVAADRPFDQRSVPGYRQIVDLSPANDSRFLDAVGQSGHFLSKHYDDFLEDWRHVRHRTMRMDRATAERDALGTLRLIPR